MDDLLLWLLAILSIASALGVIGSSQAVHSALSLTVNLLVMAVLYLFLGAEFLGLAQVLIYAGAVMVLFLFAVTLLAPREEALFHLKGNPSRLLGLFVGMVLAVMLAALMTRYPQTAASPDFHGSIQAFGKLVSSAYVLPFEATAFVLLVALMGAVVLGKKEPRG